MKFKGFGVIGVFGFVGAMLLSSSAGAAPTDRLIVKYRQSQGVMIAGLEVKSQSLSQTTGVPIQQTRSLGNGMYVLKLPSKVDAPALRQIQAKIAARTDVEYVEPDYIVHPLAVSANDDFFVNQKQWSLGSGTGGMNVVGAWQKTVGSANQVVAVVDTGVLTGHPDLQGKLLPGYDFISDPTVANDGNGRDADPSDPGDGVAAGECGMNAPAEPSSWHGSMISGIIAATSNNVEGMAGIGWSTRILPVRVLGKCGGYLSDVLDGARWAAGLPVSGVPANPNPARVINLSLGVAAACGPAEQSVFNEIKATGATVVVASANDGVNLDTTPYSPATCSNVMTVGATDRNAKRPTYSNYGSAVALSAPGGYFATSANAEDGILSLYNSDNSIINASTYCYAYGQGTSMAAAQVSGVIALMLAVKPALTPDSILDALRATAHPINDGFCNTGAYCGAGLVDAAAAVNAVMENLPPVFAALPAQNAEPNMPLRFTLSATDPEGAAVTLSSGALPSGASFDPASGVFSWTPSAGQAGKYAVTFMASDGVVSSSTIVMINVAANSQIASKSGVSTASSGGGGGCTMEAAGQSDVSLLLLPLLLWMMRTFLRRKSAIRD